MLTDAKMRANRENARKSTGPRTPEGKEKSKYNAVKHGLYAESLVLYDEKIEDFEEMHIQMARSMQPVGYHEEQLVYLMAIMIWKQLRVSRCETKVWLVETAWQQSPLPNKNALRDLIIKMKATEEQLEMFDEAIKFLPGQDVEDRMKELGVDYKHFMGTTIPRIEIYSRMEVKYNNQYLKLLNKFIELQETRFARTEMLEQTVIDEIEEDEVEDAQLAETKPKAAVTEDLTAEQYAMIAQILAASGEEPDKME